MTRSMTRSMSRTPAGSDGDEFLAGFTFPLIVVHPCHIVLQSLVSPGTCESVLYSVEARHCLTRSGLG